MNRTSALRGLALAASAWLLAAGGAFAYVVVMKDGSKVFARTRYSVKGSNAIITLENGNITQIPVSQIDVPGTDRYNKENVGNVIAISTPEEKELQTPQATGKKRENLEQFIQQRKQQELTAPPAQPARTAAPAPTAPGSAPAGGTTGTPLIDREAEAIFTEANITQYRLSPGPRVAIIASEEDAVFRAINAAAKLIVSLGSAGKATALDVSIVSASGEDGGKFKMTPDNARGLTEGSETASEFFVKRVIF
jgi:hypothetical protein